MKARLAKLDTEPRRSKCSDKFEALDSNTRKTNVREATLAEPLTT